MILPLDLLLSENHLPVISEHDYMAFTMVNDIIARGGEADIRDIYKARQYLLEAEQPTLSQFTTLLKTEMDFDEEIFYRQYDLLSRKADKQGIEFLPVSPEVLTAVMETVLQKSPKDTRIKSAVAVPLVNFISRTNPFYMKILTEASREKGYYEREKQKGTNTVFVSSVFYTALNHQTRLKGNN